MRRRCWIGLAWLLEGYRAWMMVVRVNFGWRCVSGGVRRRWTVVMLGALVSLDAHPL